MGERWPAGTEVQVRVYAQDTNYWEVCTPDGYWLTVTDQDFSPTPTPTSPPGPPGPRPAAATDLHGMDGGPALYWQEKLRNATTIVDRVQATGDLDHQDAAQLIEWLQVIVTDVQRWQQLTHARETSADTN